MVKRGDESGWRPSGRNFARWPPLSGPGPPKRACRRWLGRSCERRGWRCGSRATPAAHPQLQRGGPLEITEASAAELAAGRVSRSDQTTIDVHAHQFVIRVLRLAHAGPGHRHDCVLRHDNLGGGRGGLGVWVMVATVVVVLPVGA